MGSRVVIFGILRVALDRQKIKLINNIFGTPEIDRGLFLQNVDYVKRYSRKITLYASDKDAALIIARNASAGKPRAGDIGDIGIVRVPGIDSIDATIVDLSFFSTRHNYIASKTRLLGDLSSIIIDGKGLPRFGIRKVLPAPVYWQFVP